MDSLPKLKKCIFLFEKTFGHDGDDGLLAFHLMWSLCRA